LTISAERAAQRSAGGRGRRPRTFRRVPPAKFLSAVVGSYDRPHARAPAAGVSLVGRLRRGDDAHRGGPEAARWCWRATGCGWRRLGRRHLRALRRGEVTLSLVREAAGGRSARSCDGAALPLGGGRQRRHLGERDPGEGDVVVVFARPARRGERAGLETTWSGSSQRDAQVLPPGGAEGPGDRRAHLRAQQEARAVWPALHLGSRSSARSTGLDAEDPRTARRWSRPRAVMTWQLQPIEAYFHASCGGRTESGGEALGRDLPYLQRGLPCGRLPPATGRSTSSRRSEVAGRGRRGDQGAGALATGRARRMESVPAAWTRSPSASASGT